MSFLSAFVLVKIFDMLMMDNSLAGFKSGVACVNTGQMNLTFSLAM